VFGGDFCQLVAVVFQVFAAQGHQAAYDLGQTVADYRALAHFGFYDEAVTPDIFQVCSWIEV
jgi:hypothetical protein